MKIAKTMQRNLHSFGILAVFLIAIFSMYKEVPAQAKGAAKSQPAAVQTPAPDIHFTVSMTKPWTHLLEVEMDVKWAQMPDALELKMPVWTPGSYLVREYARHVQDFAVKDETGRPLDLAKDQQKHLADRRQRRKRDRGRLSRLRERVDRQDQRTQRRPCILEQRGAAVVPQRISLQAPFDRHGEAVRQLEDRHRTAARRGQANTFRAENYDILYDSPFEVSDFKEVSFDCRGQAAPFRLLRRRQLRPEANCGATLQRSSRRRTRSLANCRTTITRSSSIFAAAAGLSI